MFQISRAMSIRRTHFKPLSFHLQRGQLEITALCGIPLSNQGPAKTRGSILVNTGTARFEGAAWHPPTSKKTAQYRTEFRQFTTHGELELRTLWTEDVATGVVSRRDVLTNTGHTAQTIHRCLARLALPAGNYDVYTQQSRWCNENQGAWQALHAGELTLRSLSGRTTEGGTPYACLRNRQTRQGLAFHILPTGNWMIRFSSVPQGDNLPIVVVELGLSDENLRLPLLPGESLELPTILYQALPQGEPHLAAPALHTYQLSHHLAKAKPYAPVVYNTWLDHFDLLDVPRLRRQLAAARDAGCEIFVVDAGWYGAGSPNWWAQAGDWREKTRASFHGKMRKFTDEVRVAGLQFGLWMEPERIGPEAPLRTEHPEWLVPVDGSWRLDLANPDARVWLRCEIARLIETYKVRWIKMDCNFGFDIDPAGRELSGYNTHGHALLDELRETYPETFFEHCSSGGMRLDLTTLSHCDAHFLSDSADPVDILRISQGAFLRLPPGRISHWAVLRSPGAIIPRYGSRTADSPATILVPGGGLWEPASNTDLDFALLANMPGILGLSGDLAGLPPAVAARIQEHIAFFKRWRRFIAKSVAHLLTPPEPISCRNGWVAFQLQNPTDTSSLLFVYRLGVAPHPPRWYPKNLNPHARYTVRRALQPKANTTVLSGQELMEEGLTIELPIVGGSSRGCSASVHIIQPRSR